jgi:hypothetical protein
MLENDRLAGMIGFLESNGGGQRSAAQQQPRLERFKLKICARLLQSLRATLPFFGSGF